MIELYSPRGQLVQAPEAAVPALLEKGYRLAGTTDTTFPPDAPVDTAETVEQPAPKRRGRKPKAE